MSDVTQDPGSPFENAKKLGDFYKELAVFEGRCSHNDKNSPGRCTLCLTEFGVKLYEDLNKTRNTNLKLVGAIDMIRERLHGSYVDDLLFIINSALDEWRNGQ